MPSQILTKGQHRLWWQSSYDRGLQHLLKMWPSIKEKYPDAELWICYGWNLFEKVYADNPERVAWKERMTTLMEQPGVTHYGRIGKEKMLKLRQQCGIWAYPTDFTEISCIGALECQRDGCVPVVCSLAALKETVQSGVKIDGDIYDDETYDAFLNALLDMMGDEKKWREEQEKGRAFAQNYNWEKIAAQWVDVFKA